MTRSVRLNQPMVERLRRCAADTSSNWAGAVTVYPPEARELVALIDHSGVAGEPEATTKEASEIVSAVSPTPTHVDTVSGPPAADLAGGAGGLGEATRDEFVHLTDLIAERHAHALRLGAAVLAHAILDAGYRRTGADRG